MEYDVSGGPEPPPRAMLYAPWSDEPNAVRCEAFSVPGIAAARTVRALEDAGGDPAELADDLNRRVPEARFFRSAEALSSGRGRYSLEFYLFLILAAKRLMGRSDFRYEPNDGTMPDEHHLSFEQGPLSLTPWVKAEEGRLGNYLSMLNIRCLVGFAERRAAVPTCAPGRPEDIRMRWADEGMRILNAWMPDGYRMDRGLIGQEALLVSMEFIHYTYQVFQCLTNNPRFSYDALYSGFLEYSGTVRGIFLDPDITPAEGFRRWQLQTNNVYKMEFREKRGRSRIGFNLRSQTVSGVFGLYRASCEKGLRLGNSGACRAFFEIATGRPVSVKVLESDTASSDFVMEIRWKSPYRIGRIAFAAAASGLLFAAALFLAIRFILGS